MASTTAKNDDGNNPSLIFPIPVVQRPKLSGWDFYNRVLGAPKHVVI